MDFAGETSAQSKSPTSDRQRAPLIAGVALGFGLLVVLGLAWVVFGSRTENPDQLWSQAHQDFEANRWDQAERAAARLAKLRTPTTNDLLLRSQIAMARNRTDEALACLAAIPDNDPQAAQARLLSGQLELRRRRMTAAESYLKKALQRDPKLVQARKELIYLYGMQIRRADLAEQFLELGKLMPLPFDMVRLWCLTRGSIWEPTSHQKDLQLILEADPGDQRTRLALAEMFQQQGLTREAEETLAPLPSDLPDALAVRARVAFDRGDVETARELLKHGPTEHAGLARLRGRLDLLRRDPKAAIVDFEVAEKVEPGHRDSLYGLGRAYRLLGDEDRAAPYLKAAEALDRLFTMLSGAATPAARNDRTLPRKLAEASLAAGRIPEARAWLQVALARDPLDDSLQRQIFDLDQQLKGDKSP